VKLLLVLKHWKAFDVYWTLSIFLFSLWQTEVLKTSSVHIYQVKVECYSVAPIRWNSIVFPVWKLKCVNTGISNTIITDHQILYGWFQSKKLTIAICQIYYSLNREWVKTSALNAVKHISLSFFHHHVVVVAYTFTCTRCNLKLSITWKIMQCKYKVFIPCIS
jgi:hypothetical protein